MIINQIHLISEKLTFKNIIIMRQQGFKQLQQSRPQAQVNNFKL